ncbi:MAG: peroxiredoxin [Deltaproteobacteria bacterium]|nr:MAG: peroxiredoxin [Deltaproteobacteria bacterium]
MSQALEGTALPNFKLPSTSGSELSIPDDLKGKWSLLYFYPKDDTPGCTKQACGYRDGLESFKELGVSVFGVSLDDLTSHKKFINKFSLNFPLIADTNHELADALKAYGEQEWNGKKFKGLSRDTFLIDPEGIIRKIWRKVNPESTIDETKEAVKEFINK